ncbi:acyl-CoA N-acyltransferase [Fusarium flagelliforme]|uniref:acyl-CoA N-acyltransferase n=1 Tax=Fusarium flagelliforme TaxID=2675880 RepID=UPI001E8DE77C|nr:acyl-CoA N-acyltransferase [Fusarium flagelliforme]KAH7183504.1 acyl-CoA N-acyltransferase [Fusarium flagelliforme]
MSSSPVVRKASSQDIPQILSFIRDGGEEQAPGTHIPATEESLQNTLYLSDITDDKPRFGRPLLIFSPEGKPAGLLIYFFNYTTWAAAPGVCMEELYVVPEYRRHGYARLLVQALAAAAKEAGCVKMEWLCLQDNTKALKFYEKLGAVRKHDWTVLKVDEEGIDRLVQADE